MASDFNRFWLLCGDFAQSVCYDYGTDGRMDMITLINAQGRSVSVDCDWEQGRLTGCTIFSASGMPLFIRTQTRAPRGAHNNDVDFVLFVVETTSKCCLKYVGNRSLFPNPFLTCSGRLRVLAVRDWKFLHDEQRIAFKDEPSQRLSSVFPERKLLIESKQWLVRGLVFGNIEVLNDK